VRFDVIQTGQRLQQANAVHGPTRAGDGHHYPLGWRGWEGLH
jgi:hypothetical protein